MIVSSAILELKMAQNRGHSGLSSTFLGGIRMNKQFKVAGVAFAFALSVPATQVAAEQTGGFVQFSVPSMTVTNGSYGRNSWSDVSIGSRWNDPLVNAFVSSPSGFSSTTFNPSGYAETYSGSRNGDASVRIEISGSGRAEHFGTRRDGSSEASANSNVRIKTQSNGDGSSAIGDIRIRNGSESYQWKPPRDGKG